MKENTKSIISISLIMIPVIIFGALGMSVEMTIVLFAGFASAVLMNIDKFKSFKAGKLEAKLREADKVIEDAHATIGQLKEVAEPLLNTNLVSLIYDGYFDGMDIEDKLIVFEDLYKIENNLNLKSDTTSELMNKAKKAIAHHLFRDIGSAINRDPLAKDSIFFTKYSLEAEEAFATVEKIQSHFNENPNIKTEKAINAFEKFKEFINTYY